MKHKKKRPNKKIIEIFRFILKWFVPIIVTLIVFTLAAALPFPFYYKNGIVTNRILISIPLYLIANYISIELSKRWWNWLRNNDIIE